MRLGLPLGMLATATMLTSSCGEDQSGAAAATGDALTVSAASSLSRAFSAYGEATPEQERFSFAGSDDLAAQIRQGAAPDVYAAADTELPQMLFEEGLVRRPTVFARNRLVVAVPEGSVIESVPDLAEPGVDLVIGTAHVPFGSYTRDVLAKLPAGERQAILANVRSEESDVSAAVGKLTQGAADASFVYASDVAAANGQLEAIELPAGLRPEVAYAVAAVEGAENPEGARRFIDGLLSGEGAEALEAAGFDPPPDR